MKDYFNANEKDLHIKAIACLGEIEEFVKTTAITKAERKYLRYAITYLNKLNNSIFERFGTDYENRLQNTL